MASLLLFFLVSELMLHVASLSEYRTNGTEDFEIILVDYGSSINQTHAQSYCRDNHRGSLISIKSQNTTDILTQFFSEKGISSDYWIGLERSDVDCTGQERNKSVKYWRWASGEPFSDKYVNWLDAEPNNCISSKCCRAISTHKWRDVGCYWTYSYFVCQSPPGTPSPTNLPTTITSNPTVNPTTQPSSNPSKSTTSFPTKNPSINPSLEPTLNPSTSPSLYPSKNPSSNPTQNPSTTPTKSPSSNPTHYPTLSPTQNPTNQPSKSPTNNPTSSPSDRTPSPSDTPTNTPTIEPSKYPSIAPSKYPSIAPSKYPSIAPTITVVEILSV